jgi:hypothetical protein
MNKKILLLSALTVSIASAGYMVRMPLDPQHMTIDTPDEITGTIDLSPATINRGESTALNWNYNYIKSLKVVSSDKSFNETSYFGSYPLSPLVTTDYNITLDNDKKIEEKTLKLTVIQPTPVISFTADKVKVGFGQPVRLNWNVADAEAVSIDNAIGNVNLSGNFSIVPTQDTTYKMSVTGYNNENSTSRSLSIDVVNTSKVNSFTSNKTKITVGDEVTFNWSVNDSEGLELTPFGTVPKTDTSKTVTLGSIGSFDYTLKTTSLSGLEDTSNPINVTVYGLPTITSYKINNSDTAITVEQNDALDFTWAGSNNESYKLNGISVSNGSHTDVANTTGSKNYVLVGTNGAGKTIDKTINVNVVGIGALPSFTGPTSSFTNAPVVLNWSGSNISNYKLSANGSGSGVSGSQDMGTATTYTVTPTSAGNFEYTITGTNLVNKELVKKATVAVEADPTLGGFTVNGQSAVTVAPNAALSFVGSSPSVGAVAQARTASNDAVANHPSNAPMTVGSYSYYMAATKTVNGVTKYSPVRNVTVNVASNPVLGNLTAPSVVNINTSFTLSWTGNDIVSYSVSSNNNGSGIVTTGVNVGNTLSRSITPTAAGTFTYTVTGTSIVGTTVSKTINVQAENWITTTPTYTTWINNGAVTNCSNWAPAPSTATVGQSFTQTATDCKQPQTRSRQEREQETGTGAIRNVGLVITESQSITASSTRSATGTKETWIATTPTYTIWTNNGAVTSCTNWAPATSTVTVGQSFTQTATDCQQPQTRSRQDREQETTTGTIRNVGVVVTESQSITASSTRSATGTKETWVATTSTYTNWTNNGALTSCSNWTPATSTVAVGQSFTQTATDCQQPQTRSRQDREQESTTLVYRNKGAAVTENQNIVASSTRSATGIKETWAATTPTYTTWVNNGSLTSCSNWAPATSTVTVGQSFTQTATDCQQPQTRSRQDREKETTTGAFRNVGVVVTESQSITTSSTRAATGIKETWIATTPTYTTWTNNGAYSSCTAWTPSAAEIPSGTGGYQNRTCYQPQIRYRQDRQQETTTGAIRNNGAQVAESQSVGVAQPANYIVGTAYTCNGIANTWIITPHPQMSVTWNGVQVYYQKLTAGNTNAAKNILTVTGTDGKTYHKVSGAGAINSATCRSG